MSSILYGSESWLTEKLSVVNLLCHDMVSIKALLGMRQTRANDISLLVIWLPPLKHWLKQKQLNFLKQALHRREGLDDDPPTIAISLPTAAKTPTGLYITRLLNEE